MKFTDWMNVFRWFQRLFSVINSAYLLKGNQAMNEEPLQPPSQDLNISDSILETVQIAQAGRDLTLTQIQGEVRSINVFGSIQVDQEPICATKPISQQEYRWRRVLLDKVKSFWIEGILVKSLHIQVLIELGLEERSEFVQNPLREVEEFPIGSGQPFPEGTAAADIFEDIGAGRTLLILGEPGSGKTVTLLKLAESLIARTENDLSQPLPIVVNLSSWAKRRQSIADWLVQELHQIYGVSKSLGKAWVDQEQLILLLDGLDEVEAKYRNDCAKALNQFIQKHGLTEMVVCSRIRDYEKLSESLKLHSAIYIQPLIKQQIDKFLEWAGESLSGLRTILQHNPELQVFASSPLILSIMGLSYQNCPAESLPKAGTHEYQRKQLFDNYIDRMLMRRGTTRQYSREQTLHWLIWLAQQMVQASQTIFLIERLQPSWLSSQCQRAEYLILSSLISGLIIGLIYGLTIYLAVGFVGLTQMQNIGLINVLTNGLIGGLTSGLIYGLTTGLIIGLMYGIWVLLRTFLFGPIRGGYALLRRWKHSNGLGVKQGKIFGMG